jgi:hypothetical protein
MLGQPSSSMQPCAIGLRPTTWSSPSSSGGSTATCPFNAWRAARTNPNSRRCTKEPEPVDPLPPQGTTQGVAAASGIGMDRSWRDQCCQSLPPGACTNEPEPSSAAHKRTRRRRSTYVVTSRPVRGSTVRCRTAAVPACRIVGHANEPEAVDPLPLQGMTWEGWVRVLAAARRTGEPSHSRPSYEVCTNEPETSGCPGQSIPGSPGGSTAGRLSPYGPPASRTNPSRFPTSTRIDAARLPLQLPRVARESCR